MRGFLGTAVAVIVFAGAASAANADSSLVGQWHLDEGSGTVASDSSGYSNNGTVSGAATWVPGHFGSALSFDGTTGVVQVPDSPSLEPSSAVTVSAWVQHTGTPGAYRYIVAKGESGCYSASYGLYSGANGGLAFYVYNGHGTSYVVSPDAGSGVWDGAWHLVVGTYDGTAVRLYVDGNQIGSGTPRSGAIPYASPDSNDLFIGGYPEAAKVLGCPAGSFQGLIDEVDIWSRALSATEVNGLLTGPTTGSTGGGPTPGGDPGSTPGPGPAGPHSHPPQISKIKVSRSVPSRADSSGATISYTLTQAAHLTFRILLAQRGAVLGRRCVKAAKVSDAAPIRHCVHVVTLAHFVDIGHAGINRVRFDAGTWRKLAPGRYTLDATPSANGQTGKMATTTFTVRH